MSVVQNTNFPILSVDSTVEMLSGAYISLIRAGRKVSSFPAVMLWGPPGVGKSQGVRQIAEKIKSETGKKVNVTDVRLLLFNPIDLRGIPTANEDKTLAVWLRPQIFQMDESESTVNILFLDEISAAPQSVQAAAYQITLDRKVGEHMLPDNCIVICAGNRVTDKSVATKMPGALANRLMHLEIEGSVGSWLSWAVTNGVHGYVTGFIASKGDALFGFDPSRDDYAFATPRTWEMVSNILKTVSDDIDKVYSLIAGLVGNGNAIQLRSWCKLNIKLPKAEDIFSGKTHEVPRELDLIYAVTSSMTAYAREHKDNKALIANSLIYAQKLPPDFAMLLIKSYTGFTPEYEKFLLGLPEYITLARKAGAWRNGRV